MFDNLKATLPRSPALNGRNYGGEKEMVRAMSAVVYSRGELLQPVKVRWYMGRKADGAGRVYCSVWIHGRGTECAGHGWAGGYGYDKESAAFESALGGAEVTLSESIGGAGDTATRAALESIVRAMGYSGKVLLISH